MRHGVLITLWILFLFGVGCSTVKTPAPPATTLPAASDHFRKGQILDLQAGKAISFEELIKQVSSKDLLFVGEVHDNPDHHLIQIQILQSLVDISVPFTMGMEFFQVNQQAPLDRYLLRDISEEEFLREVDWNASWGFDYHLYRPLILFARQNGFGIIALNAPQDIVKKVAKLGLNALDAGEREQIARDIDLANEGYRAYMKSAYGEHSHGDLKNFDYFYEAQCVRDETMSENVAREMKAGKGKMIVFTGNGHMEYGFGVPDRTIRRYPASMATLMLLPVREGMVLDKEMADYLWLTNDCPHQGMRLD